jgi:hypothetical protein
VTVKIKSPQGMGEVFKRDLATYTDNKIELYAASQNIFSFIAYPMWYHK